MRSAAHRTQQRWPLLLAAGVAALCASTALASRRSPADDRHGALTASPATPPVPAFTTDPAAACTADTVTDLAADLAPGPFHPLTRAQGVLGRITARDVAAFSYDLSGRRSGDDRFTYTWVWRGNLVQVDVKEDAGVVSETCGGSCDRHRVRYERDALGRLLTRIHEVPTDTGYQALSTRRFVWDGDTLVAEMALESNGLPLWKAPHLPGPGGLDDTVALRLDTNLLATAATAHLALVRDEMGSVIALARDDPDGGPPHLVARVLYTPYGEAHLELGPEPLAATYDPALTTLDNQQQQIQPPAQPGDPVTAAPGGAWLRTTSALDPATVAAGLSLVTWNQGLGLWEIVPPAAYVAKVEPVTVSLRLMPLGGWTSGARYEVRYSTAVTDPSGRALQVPPTEPAPGDHVRFAVAVAADGTVDARERRWTPEYDSAAAAGSTLGGILPGGTTTLFQGMWTDPVTGHAHARARVLDTRHGVWLSEDPLDLDSPNLYAFVAWQPQMAVDPTGMLCEDPFSWDGLQRCSQDIGWVNEEFHKGVLLHPWQNLQRGVGGAVGVVKFGGKTVYGLGSLAADALLAQDPTNVGAQERLALRAEGLVEMLAHSVDAAGQSWNDMADAVLADEAAGNYLGSGMEAGEWGTAAGATVIGAAETGAALTRLGVRGMGALRAGTGELTRTPWGLRGVSGRFEASRWTRLNGAVRGAGSRIRRWLSVEDHHSISRNLWGKNPILRRAESL